MAYKILINKTGLDVNVILIPRIGSQPPDPGKAIEVPLSVGETKTVNYGDPQDPYLDAVTVSAVVDGAAVEESQEVVTRGCAWDDTMNTKDTLTINSVRGLDITGSQTR